MRSNRQFWTMAVYLDGRGITISAQFMVGWIKCWLNFQMYLPITILGSLTKVVYFVQLKCHTKRYSRNDCISEKTPPFWALWIFVCRATRPFSSKVRAFGGSDSISVSLKFVSFWPLPILFFRINSCSWVGGANNHYVFLERVGHLESNRDPVFGWKLRLGYGAVVQCRRLPIFALCGIFLEFDSLCFIHSQCEWNLIIHLYHSCRIACGGSRASRVQRIRIALEPI